MKKNNIFKRIINRLRSKTFYALVNINDEDKYLTITRTKKQAEEYVDKYLKSLHASHYLKWCEYQKLSDQNKNTWIKYCATCLSPDKLLEYVIIPLRFDEDRLTSVLRMFIGSLPLCCSFETPAEMINLHEKVVDNQLSEEELDLLENSIKLDPQAKVLYESLEKLDLENLDLDNINIEEKVENNGTK